MENSFAKSFWLCALAVLSGCAGSSSKPPANEVVLCPGSELSVKRTTGNIKVTAGSISSRKVHTADTSLEVLLVPRHERWYGSFGQYAATGSSPDVHVTAEEGFQHFASPDELVHWLSAIRERGEVAYTSDGLVLLWKYSSRPVGHVGGPDAALTLEIWQTWVKGEKPKNLDGATDADFSKRHQPAEACSSPPQFVASDPAVIDGRSYSGRALDFLKERGLQTRDVEEVLRNGASERNGATTVYLNPREGEKILYVELSTDGKVQGIG